VFTSPASDAFRHHQVGAELSKDIRFLFADDAGTRFVAAVCLLLGSSFRNEGFDDLSQLARCVGRISTASKRSFLDRDQLLGLGLQRQSIFITGERYRQCGTKACFSAPSLRRYAEDSNFVDAAPKNWQRASPLQ